MIHHPKGLEENAFEETYLQNLSIIGCFQVLDVLGSIGVLGFLLDELAAPILGSTHLLRPDVEHKVPTSAIDARSSTIFYLLIFYSEHRHQLDIWVVATHIFLFFTPTWGNDPI